MATTSPHTSSAPRVSVQIEGHGSYSCPADILDLMIVRYLPNSTSGLRDIVAERVPEIDWNGIVDLTTFLVILGDWAEGERINERSADERRVRTGDRVRFTSGRFAGDKYGDVTSWATNDFATYAVVTISDGTTYEVPVSDCVRVHITTGHADDLTAGQAGDLVELARSLRSDHDALYGKAGIPKTQYDRGRADGYRGACERIESLFDRYGVTYR